MRSRSMRNALAAVLAAALVAAGCETTGQSVGLGALTGAAAGAVIGHQSGHAAEGALIGAAVGAAAGWAAHKIVKNRQSRLAKGAQETATEYNYQPEQGFRMELKGGGVAPGTVKRGDNVVTTFQYATLGTGSGVEVEEICLLKSGNQTLTELDRRTVKRTDGTWENIIEFQVPSSADAGEYIVTQNVSAQGKTLEKDLSFQVKTKTAQAPRQGERVVLSFVVVE